jgi:gamma-glutamylcyclotransferase (GGCT)/AIG2-like uncharacterized protein YtfP
MEQLFSYGTLQIEEVQFSTFGRRLAGESDSLSGYRQARVEIRDADAIAANGAEYYLNAEFTGNDSDSVSGTRFEVTRNELEQADAYEATADYKRVRVQLKSGVQSWVYVNASGTKFHQ